MCGQCFLVVLLIWLRFMCRFTLSGEMYYDYLVRKLSKTVCKNDGFYLVRFFIVPNKSTLIGVQVKYEFFSIRLI